MTSIEIRPYTGRLETPARYFQYPMRNRRAFNPGATITAIRVQDVARHIWYSWNNGYWDNAGGSGNNAPVGQAPFVTPGAGNLYIAFYAVSNATGYVTVQIYAYGTTQASKIVYVSAGGGAGVEWTGNMTTGPLPIALMASP